MRWMDITVLRGFPSLGFRVIGAVRGGAVEGVERESRKILHLQGGDYI